MSVNNPSSTVALLVPGIFALAGVIIGGAFSEISKIMDRKSQERSRRLDLYKTVFPEKIKAVSGLMEMACDSFRHIRDYRIMLDNSILDKLPGEIQNVSLFAFANEWLLGPQITQVAEEYKVAAERCVHNFRVAKIEHSHTISESNEEEASVLAKMEAIYQGLTHCVRRQTQIEIFDDLFTTPR